VPGCEPVAVWEAQTAADVPSGSAFAFEQVWAI